MHKTAFMANLSDKTVKNITIAAICLYGSMLIAGLDMHKELLYVSLVNAAAGILVISYWIWEKLRPFKRTTETREVIVLLIECIIVALAFYTIISSALVNWLAIVQYIIFAIHALLLVVFLVFMLTFKIKKLL